MNSLKGKTSSFSTEKRTVTMKEVITKVHILWGSFFPQAFFKLLLFFFNLFLKIPVFAKEKEWTIKIRFRIIKTMGLLAHIKLLSCTGVYRIRVLGNNCNLKWCFKSWGTTVNRTRGLLARPLQDKWPLCAALRRRKQSPKCLSARLYPFPSS